MSHVQRAYCGLDREQDALKARQKLIGTTIIIFGQFVILVIARTYDDAI
jgi:hypothetical protein